MVHGDAYLHMYGIHIHLMIVMVLTLWVIIVISLYSVAGGLTMEGAKPAGHRLSPSLGKAYVWAGGADCQISENRLPNPHEWALVERPQTEI